MLSVQTTPFYFASPDSYSIDQKSLFLTKAPRNESTSTSLISSTGQKNSKIKHSIHKIRNLTLFRLKNHPSVLLQKISMIFNPPNHNFLL